MTELWTGSVRNLMVAKMIFGFVQDGNPTKSARLEAAHFRGRYKSVTLTSRIRFLGVVPTVSRFLI
jgi:hypothetical protein